MKYAVGEKLRGSTADLKLIVGLEADVKAHFSYKMWPDRYDSLPEAMSAITKDIVDNYKWACDIRVYYNNNTDKGIPFGFDMNVPF